MTMLHSVILENLLCRDKPLHAKAQAITWFSVAKTKHDSDVSWAWLEIIAISKTLLHQPLILVCPYYSLGCILLWERIRGMWQVEELSNHSTPHWLHLHPHPVPSCLPVSYIGLINHQWAYRQHGQTCSRSAFVTPSQRRPLLNRSA